MTEWWHLQGDDHLNEYDKMLEGVCECHYLPRTKGVSSTDLKRQISSDSICSADWGSSPPDAIPLIKNMSYNSLASIGEDEDGSSSDETDKEASPLLSAIPDPTPDVAKVEETKEQKMPEESVQQPAKDAYSAANKNLVHSTEQTNPVTAFLVDAHDRYYQWVMDTCTPFCAMMPREVTVGGRTVTIFTANIVTYARGFLAIPIVLGMKYGWLWTASFLVMYHDFLDHLDGVVAKQQAKDGRSKGDDGMWGAFLDAQMDKLVFCQLLWSFVMMMDYCSWTADLLVVLTCTLLFGLEFTIGAVRTQDYFQAKYQPATSGGPALRAVSEGKLKQKFESTGIAFYCLALPDPASNMLATFLGTTCLWFAAYYSLQSLMHKLNARTKCE